MLQCEQVHSGYGAIEALHGISLNVRAGEIVTLIGANGAGKSTLLMTLCGQPRACSGKIIFDGQDITRRATPDIMRMGMAIAPEGRRVFAALTVLENLQLGGFFASKEEIAAGLKYVFSLFPRLRERSRQAAGTMSGGEQQMLAIGRALMSNPRVLMMDEPSEGLAPQIVAEVGRIIAGLREEGLSILLVEQNLDLAMSLANDVVILNTGRVAAFGKAADIASNQDVIDQNLGVF